MGRFAAILLAVSGTVALQVVAQAVVLASVRFLDRHTRGATEFRQRESARVPASCGEDPLTIRFADLHRAFANCGL